MFFIGVDLGTSSVKLVLMDEKGTIHGTTSREYPLYFPQPGWSEQNPEDWYREAVDGLKELLKDVDKTQVAGISFGGQMHGLVILDENDNVIRPAILWNDGRTQKQVDYLNGEIGKDKLSEYTANIAFAGFTAPKIHWVEENEPENFKKIKKIMLPKDYLAYKFTGTFCTDYSDASGMLLLDVKNRKWSKEMCDICHITEDMLPQLFESYEKVGELTKELSSELGLNAGVVVAAGAGDNAAAAVGTGTVGNNRCNISLGTSGTIFMSADSFAVDKNNALHSFDHADGHFHLMGCMLSAASCNKWWMDEILKTKDYADELGFCKDVKIIAGAGDNAAAAVGTGTVGDGKCNISLGTSGTIFISSKDFTVDDKNALHAFAHSDGHYHLMGCMLSAASCNKWWMEDIIGTTDFAKEQEPITEDKLGENNVFFMPYLMGERSPHNNPDARAVFIGMSMDSTRADMTQAVLEGVCFGIRDSFEVARSQGIKIESTKICGGGAKSPLWKKMMANVLGIPVEVIESEEGPGYGGAILAAVGCGEYASVEEAADKLVKVIDVVKPDAELTAKYEERYQTFKQIYPALKEVFPKM